MVRQIDRPAYDFHAKPGEGASSNVAESAIAGQYEPDQIEPWGSRPRMVNI